MLGQTLLRNSRQWQAEKVGGNSGLHRLRHFRGLNKVFPKKILHSIVILFNFGSKFHLKKQT